MSQIIEVPGMGQVEFPDGMTDEQIVAAIKANTSTTPVGERFIQGMRDPIDAGAQLLAKSLPSGVVGAVNRATGFINKLPGIGPATRALGMTPATPEHIDKGITQREAAYKSPQGVDWARMGGTLATTLPLAAMAPLAQSLMGSIGIGAATGGGLSALQPVTRNQDNFLAEKAKQVGIGALTGGIAGPAMRGLARVVSPQTSPQVRQLMSEGVTPTPGQILGGAAKSAEERLTSMPILGDAIRSAQRKGVEELNRSAYARALAPIGGTVPNEPGRDAVASVSRQLSDAYNKLLPKLQFKADQTFAQELGTVQQMAANLPPTQAGQFEKILRNQVIGKLTPQGNASGETIKAIESDLGRLVGGYKKSLAFDERQLGDALAEVQSIIRRTLERVNPAHAQELANINQGYSIFARIRDAASRQGSQEGVFTPAQLSAAVRAGDRSVGKGNFARGTALLQNLSDPAVNTLKQGYPDSGSIGRLLLGAGALGAGTISPAIPGALGVASLPYLPIGRQISAALLARRPELAEPVANAIRRAPAGLLSPMLYPALEQ